MNNDLMNKALLRGLKMGLTNPNVDPQQFTEHFLETLDVHGERVLEEILEADSSRQSELRHQYYQEIAYANNMLDETRIRAKFSELGINWKHVKKT